MGSFELTVALAKLAESLLPDKTINQQKEHDAAISQDGSVRAGSLPQPYWSTYVGNVAGTAATGSNILCWPFPQGGVIRRVSFDARTAPSGGNFAFTLTGGDESESFSLQSGSATEATRARIVVQPGAWVRLNVNSVSSAADITVVLHYMPGVPR